MLTLTFNIPYIHVRGLTKIEDFFQGNRFLTFEEFCSKFQIKTNFGNYYGLCHAVPQKWINILKGNFTELLEKRSEKERISLDKLSCKSATKFFVKSKFVTPTTERRMTDAGLKEHTIRLIYSLPFNVTKDTRLAIFQYKVIHHILPTNPSLFRDSIKEHDKCHLCGERQTLIHAQLFWSLFTIWWNSKNGDTITIDKNEIIHGVTDNFARHLGLNLCLKERRRVLFRCLLSDFDKSN